MHSWVVTTNQDTYSFAFFGDAVNCFKKLIKDYIRSGDDIFINDCTPFQVGCFFSTKYDNGEITDEEIAISTRVDMLLNCLMWHEPKYSKKDALNIIKKNIRYNGINHNKEFDEKLSLSIEKKDSEIIYESFLDDGDETYLKTNAFIFDDHEKTYYYKSHQIVVASTKKDVLGTNADCDIVLECKQ